MEDIYNKTFFNKGWSGGKHRSTICGSGSTLKYTGTIRKKLPELIKKYGIKTIADAGCGDKNWIKHTNLLGAVYTGYDLIPRDESTVSFNVVTQILPTVDLIICRSVLYHLPNEMIIQSINNFKASSSKFLLANCFLDVTNESRIMTAPGKFNAINLLKTPFNFPEPLELFIESPLIENVRVVHIGLWNVSQLNYGL